MDDDDSTTPPETEEKPSHLSIKVIGQDGHEVFFKIKPSTKLGKLMKAWCERRAVTESSVRFLFDGDRIDKDATAEELGMEDGDIVDAVLRQVGGGPDIRLVLATNCRCYFCGGGLNPKLLFMFRGANRADLLAPLHGACFPCAVRNAEEFEDAPGENIPHLKAESGPSFRYVEII